MTRKMIINAVDPEEVRIAIIEGRLLEDFDIETRSVEKNKGNIYKGVVMAVEPALNAAFVNYGSDKQGFLTANDVHPKYAAEGVEQDKYPKVTQLLKPKQTVLVQVSKDEVGSKGAVLTTYLSLAGRYLVLMPDSETQGVSRKIEDEETRRKVREAASKLDVPPNMGVIIRTAGKDRTKQHLNRDLRILLRLWENIQKEAVRCKAPALIFKEQDVIIRALRDYFSPDIDEIVLDSDEAYDRAAEYMHLVMPNHSSALTRYVERRPIYNHYRIEEQLEVIYAPKVTLPSGGSIVIEPTEALVAIDVNSGKQKSTNQEETALQTNTEAAIEAARQLRLRDLGGIIVIDFIDMLQRKNQQKVEKVLKDALRSDKARVKIRRISPNGTLEITRQRIRSALQASVFDTCSICRGTGHVLNPASHAVSVLRKLRDRASRGDLRSAKVAVAPAVYNLLRNENWPSIQEIEKRHAVRVEIVVDHTFASGQEDFTFENDPNAVAMPLEEPNFGPAPRPEYDQTDMTMRELDEFDDKEDDEATDNVEVIEETPEDDEDTDTSKATYANKQENGLNKGRHTPRHHTRGTHHNKKTTTLPHISKQDDEYGLPEYEMLEADELKAILSAHHRSSARTNTRKPQASNVQSVRSAAPAKTTSRAHHDQPKNHTQHKRRAHTPKSAAQPSKSAAAVEPTKKPSLLSRLFGWKWGS